MNLLSIPIASKKKPPSGGLETLMFQQVRWYFLQFVVAVGVFACIEFTIGTKDFGLAPAILSMVAAWLVTLAVSGLVDWRRKRTLRRASIRHQPQSDSRGRAGAGRHPSNSAKLIAGRRVGQDVSKLI